MGLNMNAETIVALIIGSGGLIFGLYQYTIAQKWKKSEFAAKQLEMIINDPILLMCCTCLDLETRKMVVPAQYREMMDDDTFIHKWNVLSTAMLPEAEQFSFTWQEVIYRDSFDYFFNYFERIDHYISIGLITVKDVSNLEYWLRQIATPRFTEKNIFEKFIKAYEYTGVLSLMNRFNVAFRK